MRVRLQPLAVNFRLRLEQLDFIARRKLLGNSSRGNRKLLFNELIKFLEQLVKFIEFIKLINRLS